WLSGSLKFLVPFALLIGLGSQFPRRAAPPANPAIVTTMLVGLAAPFPEAPPPDPAPVSRNWLPAALAASWACGFTTMFLLRVRGWRRIRRAVQSGRPIGMSCPFEVRSTPGLLEPGVVGLWRPVLLLPEGIHEILNPGQLDAVVA